MTFCGRQYIFIELDYLSQRFLFVKTMKRNTKMAPLCSCMRIEKLNTMEEKTIGLTKDRSSNNPISKEGFQNMCIHLYTLL